MAEEGIKKEIRRKSIKKSLKPLGLPCKFGGLAYLFLPKFAGVFRAFVLRTYKTPLLIPRRGI